MKGGRVLMLREGIAAHDVVRACGRPLLVAVACGRRHLSGHADCANYKQSNSARWPQAAARSSGPTQVREESSTYLSKRVLLNGISCIYAG